MNKIIILILCLCCAFTIARAEEGPALNPSDANIVGHVVDRKARKEARAIYAWHKKNIGINTADKFVNGILTNDRNKKVR